MKQILKYITCIMVLFICTKGHTQNAALATLIDTSALVIKAVLLQIEPSGVRTTESTSTLYYKVIVTTAYKGNAAAPGDTIFIIVNHKICESPNDTASKPNLNTPYILFLNRKNNRYQGLTVFSFADQWFGWYPGNACLEEQIKKICVTKNKNKQ